MSSIVSLDIETTGLDSDRDEIIEIGAVRFNHRRVEEEWSTLLRPRRSIPPFVTQLTGISNDMVARAPRIQEVLPDLIDFVGDSPVLGHNVKFDLSFFHRRGVLLDQDRLDTYDLAAVLLPGAGRYNLSALGQALGIPLPATHRALDDARVTHAVFVNLYERALALPVELLNEIVRLGEPLDWGGDWIFRQALRERSKVPVGSRQVDRHAMGPLFDPRPRGAGAPLQPIAEGGYLDPEEVAALLEHGGAVSCHFPHFEYRPQQVEMLRAVTEALSECRHLMVEAGTGTGKSIAYLIPAGLWAVENNTRVVISTNTINLQDQLIHKDIPDLEEALGITLSATVLKGRSNYLCPRRLEALLRAGPQTEEEIRVLAKVLVWLQETETGDRSEINLTGAAERAVWRRLSAEDEGCTTETCLRRMGGVCPFHQAHQAAQGAHLLIVNHALLLADIATGNRVLPEYSYLIVDEAHHMESATTNALSYRITEPEVARLFRELGGTRSGVLGTLLTLSQELLSPDQYGQLSRQAEQVTDLAFHFQNELNRFFVVLDDFLAEMRGGRAVGPYAHQARIVPATRTQPAWMEVEMVWDEAQRLLQSLLQHIAGMGEIMADLLDAEIEDLEDAYNHLSTLYRRFGELDHNLTGLVFDPSPELIYWVEVQPSGRRISLHAAPLHIGPLMQEHLWHKKDSIVLTSATLTAAGEFDYLRNRLYGDDAYELALGSPFDYETAAMVYLINNIPEPSDRRGHQRALERGLIDLCRTTGGRTLVLFTSYAQLRRTSAAIAPALAEEGIHVYEQGTGASAHALLENFRAADQAVLLGTRSFWEGVDVPGEALSVLVIVKLPFDVPSDPIVASRSETFEDPFYQYSLPEAILRFRQGFGRLIRTQMDRGVVAVFDRRVLSKSYGRAFIESLPPSTVRTGPLQDLPEAAARWLNL